MQQKKRMEQLQIIVIRIMVLSFSGITFSRQPFLIQTCKTITGKDLKVKKNLSLKIVLETNSNLKMF